MDANLAPGQPSVDDLLAEHLAVRPNVHVLTDWLATGGDLHPDTDVALADLAGLVDLGVTHILDVRIEWSDEELVAHHVPELTYVHLGIDDAGQRLPDEWFDTGIAVAEQARRAGGMVLAHCHMGINRGPSMAFALLLHAGWEPVSALDHIRRRRPVAAVGYAADALDHHHRRADTPLAQRAEDRRAVADWFEANHLDVRTIIRGIRAAEGGTAFN